MPFIITQMSFFNISQIQRIILWNWNIISSQKRRHSTYKWLTLANVHTWCFKNCMLHERNTYGYLWTISI